MNIENNNTVQPANLPASGSGQQPARPVAGQVAQPVIGHYASHGQQGVAQPVAGQHGVAQPVAAHNGVAQPGVGQQYPVPLGAAAPGSGAPKLAIPTNQYARKAFLLTGIIGLVLALLNFGTVLFGFISFFAVEHYYDGGFVERTYYFFVNVLGGFTPAAIFLAAAALIYAFAKRDN